MPSRNRGENKQYLNLHTYFRIAGAGVRACGRATRDRVRHRRRAKEPQTKDAPEAERRGGHAESPLSIASRHGAATHLTRGARVREGAEGGVSVPGGR